MVCSGIIYVPFYQWKSQQYGSDCKEPLSKILRVNDKKVMLQLPLLSSRMLPLYQTSSQLAKPH